MSTHPEYSVVTEGLRPYVDEERLDQNAAAYPEMQVALSDRDHELVSAVREHLLRVPILHTFKERETVRDMLRDGLFSGGEQGNASNTHAIDRSLGLDGYVFATWGEQGTEQYGIHSVVLNTPRILENAVVTPADICAYVEGRRLLQPFKEQSPEVQAKIEKEYFTKMVRGTDWLEINARRIANNLTTNGASQPPVHMEEMALGEIKHRGRVVPEHIMGSVGAVDVSDQSHVTTKTFEDYMLNMGFVPRSIEYTLQWGQDIADLEQAQRQASHATKIWRKILGVVA